MKAFTKIVNPGTVPCGRRNFNVYCRIKVTEDGCLAISGVVGPTKSGNCQSAGQIVHAVGSIENAKLAGKWNPKMLKEFVKIWKDWHLNDLTAGSPKQEAFIRKYIDEGNSFDYKTVCGLMKEEGIYVDESFIHEGKPYRYGTAWLKRELPESVVSFLASLPESVKQPAWV